MGVCPTGTLLNFCLSSTRPQSICPFWELSYRDLGLCICCNVVLSPRAWTVVSLPRAKGRISQWLFLLWENRSSVAPVGKKGRDGCLVRSTARPGMGDAVVVAVSCPSLPGIRLDRSLDSTPLTPPLPSVGMFPSELFGIWRQEPLAGFLLHGWDLGEVNFSEPQASPCKIRGISARSPRSSSLQLRGPMMWKVL